MLAKREHWRVKRRVPALVQGRVGTDAFVRPAERSEARISYVLAIHPGHPSVVTFDPRLSLNNALRGCYISASSIALLSEV